MTNDERSEYRIKFLTTRVQNLKAENQKLKAQVTQLTERVKQLTIKIITIEHETGRITPMPMTKYDASATLTVESLARLKKELD